MTTPQSQRAQREDLRRDLEATLEARREMGPSYDDEFLDALVERLQLQQRPAPPPPARSDGMPPGQRLALAICSLIFGIPLVAIAAGISNSIAGGLVGITVVCLAILGVNYFASR